MVAPAREMLAPLVLVKKSRLAAVIAFFFLLLYAGWFKVLNCF